MLAHSLGRDPPRSGRGQPESRPADHPTLTSGLIWGVSELSGRTFLVTGGNTGIGLATAGDLAARGGRGVGTCRSAEKGAATVAALTAATGNDAVTFLSLDLADLDSVRECAAAFRALGE